MTRRTRRAHKRTPQSTDPFARKRRAAAMQRDDRKIRRSEFGTSQRGDAR